MKKYKILLAILSVLLWSSLSVMAQEEESPVELVPFTSSLFNIEGVMPDGWREISAGVYARAKSPLDAAIMAQQSSPVTSEQLLTALLPQMQLTEAPESVGTYETEAFTWTLYQVEINAPGVTIVVDLALADGEGRSYLALLQSSEQEHDSLYDSVFVPILDAFKPLTQTAATEEPQEDVPYVVEAVTFEHDDITLAGTLTLPDTEGTHPAIILISGSGPSNRDESLEPLAKIKPFQLIADHLTRAGIAVLRYDDRGVGESTGDYASATSADFADDTEAALDYLLARPEINAGQIGLLGHSEGGAIAAILAARRDDVAFVISMAGPSVTGLETMVVQLRRAQSAAGITEDNVARQSELQETFLRSLIDGDEEQQRAALYNLIVSQLESMSPEQLGGVTDIEAYAGELANQQLAGYQSDWMKFFVTYDPAEDWAKITAPVLVLLGELDVQVDANQHRQVFDEVFAEHPDYTIVIFPTANHLFQDAVTGGVDEYGTLEQEFAADFLPTITDWLLERVEIAE